MTPVQHLLELQRENREKSDALLTSIDDKTPVQQAAQSAKVELYGEFWNQVNAIINALQA